MSEEQRPNSNETSNQAKEVEESSELALQPGEISKWLSQEGKIHYLLENDHLGVETIGVEANDLLTIASALKSYGFNYLQCQGGYDEGPGKRLVCFYNLVSMGIETNKTSEPSSTIREIRLKVFLSRDGDLRVPSLYQLFRGADWQERETYDMFGINFDGHPHPKRLLMPEDWKGWPLRKDYVQPDFYEMQDAY